jgi:hypothetical protein
MSSKEREREREVNTLRQGPKEGGGGENPRHSTHRQLAINTCQGPHHHAITKTLFVPSEKDGASRSKYLFTHTTAPP